MIDGGAPIYLEVNEYTIKESYSAIFAGLHSAVGSASDSRARGHGFDTRSGHSLSFLLPLVQEGQ